MKKTFVIAEAGVNHNGNFELAKELVSAAAECGADAIKFQTFNADRLVTACVEKTRYQKKSSKPTESQKEMLKKLELPLESFKEIQALCLEKNIKFLSTAFDQGSLNLIANTLNVDTLKVASGEITNFPLLLAHARTKKKLIVSTGMCNLSEIQAALKVISYGLIAEKNDIPSHPDSFLKTYLSSESKDKLRQHVTLLHCTTEYPAPLDEINLHAITTIKNAFGLPVGYSDHSEGITVSLAAVAKGASIIEKHFTLDQNFEGPDHKASLNPDDFTRLVKEIRYVERALGSHEKVATSSELANSALIRKSVVAARSIAEGELFSEANLTTKRPGTGTQPKFFWSLLGKTAKKKYNEDEPI